MTKSEIINEMLELSCTYRHDGICEISQRYCMDTPCNGYKNMEKLFDAGYRKASDVAREIFEEIDDLLHHDERDFDDLMDSETAPEIYNEHLACSNYIYGVRQAIAELKIKYMENKGE